MEIKYARGVAPKVFSNEKAERQGTNYSGASWNRQLGPNFIGRPMTTRARLRAAGQTKGKQNPLLGACRSRAQSTGHLMHPVGLSVHSSKPQNRRAIKEMQKQWAKQQDAEAENEDVTNVVPVST